jgi:hypothetical protein
MPAMRKQIQLLCACLATALAGLGLDARHAPQAGQGPRIVAIADIHGAAEGLSRILRAAGLVDAADRWVGGTARLVQTGDFTDRGKDVRAVMDLLMRLEGEARRAGGRVDVLLGNHEGMNLLHDTRDVSHEAYASFADSRSEDRRRKAFETHAAIAARMGTTVEREPWMAAHPPGYVEYTQAFGPSGKYGRWLRARKVVLLAEGTIFMHAGLAPDTTGSLDDVNRGVEREVRAWDALLETLEAQRLIAPSFTLVEIVNAAQAEIGRIAVAQKTGEPLGDHVTREYFAQLQQLSGIQEWALIAGEGPLWYRGLATLPEDGEPAVAALLARFGASRFVVGHTPQLPGRINVRLGGRVVLLDTGMLASVYKGGQPSALEIQNGRLTAIYASGREPLATGPAPGSRVSVASPVFTAANAH